MISRRRLTLGAVAAGSVLWGGAASARTNDAALRQAIAALERRHGGRLGVAIADTALGQPFAFRGDERFALCSTHKLLAAAFVLLRVDRMEENLSRRVVYAKSDLVTYSPTTGKHVGDGMAIGELCEAAVTVSDNTAANLLLDSFGGPAALTGYLHTLGDNVTRLDRRETALNENAPGDPRDTTTPLAMLGTMRKLVLERALSAASRAQLVAWLVGCKTGDNVCVPAFRRAGASATRPVAVATTRPTTSLSFGPPGVRRSLLLLIIRAPMLLGRNGMRC